MFVLCCFLFQFCKARNSNDVCELIYLETATGKSKDRSYKVEETEDTVGIDFVANSQIELAMMIENQAKIYFPNIAGNKVIRYKNYMLSKD